MYVLDYFLREVFRNRISTMKQRESEGKITMPQEQFCPEKWDKTQIFLINEINNFFLFKKLIMTFNLRFFEIIEIFFSLCVS